MCVCVSVVHLEPIEIKENGSLVEPQVGGDLIVGIAIGSSDAREEIQRRFGFLLRASFAEDIPETECFITGTSHN